MTEVHDPKETVRRGYDAIAERYTAWADSFEEPLLRNVATWLRPGGLFLATLGTARAEDVAEADWLAAPMFFASFDDEENRRMLGRAGLHDDEGRVVPFEESGHGLVRFMSVVATRAA